ncbi:Putative uncharacterized protein [Moritella viscosa]|uniref:Uncharacterized protein n=1 Tax=Moritella viscosa TaxID=80854 RepID=A0A1L0AYS0_9GAMM|nr:Putative uncharacterized protein [Moritella viscosa]SGY87264.1 Putative uncharacterized protein [Moritella viscosa]SGY88801.1 Putative uncharacterized protein [Moritella viscosa]SGY89267.1 Putative uncharacterized protein [Moritella viscosa]SHO00439.1 Putative uncharacterized protein [Moritella viscosa]
MFFMFENELYGRVVIFLNEVGAMLKRQFCLFSVKPMG